MAAAPKKVRVINTRDRSYNGVQARMTAEIDERELADYINAGFDLVRDLPKEEKKEEDRLPPPEDDKPKSERDLIMAELTALGIPFKDVATKTVDLKTLLEESKAALAEEKSE